LRLQLSATGNLWEAFCRLVPCGRIADSVGRSPTAFGQLARSVAALPHHEGKLVVVAADWFDTSRQQTDLTEVNFLAPSTKGKFRAFNAGALFLLKLHAPRECIVGCLS